MLGHRMCYSFRNYFDTWVTTRSDCRDSLLRGLCDTKRLLAGVSAADFDTVVRVFAEVRPNVVVNCIGIVKQSVCASDPLLSVTVNSVFPHRLGDLCRATGARLIQISTDCVFSGRKGNYSEEDVSDAEDIYGRTKYLGEVTLPGCITLRTSIIGRELSTGHGLLEWFVSNQGGRVPGYRRAVFSGFTTQALAEIVSVLIEKHPELSGLYHVASEPTTKYDLLSLIRDAMKLEITIECDDSVRVDRSLDGSRFRAVTGIVPPGWGEMVEDLARDPIPYESWRTSRVS